MEPISLTIPVRRLLERLRTGPLVIVDGDAVPFDDETVELAKRLGYISIYEGSGWSASARYTLEPKGWRALGVDVPVGMFEAISDRVRSIFGPMRE